jgi:hypothetical protein
MVQLVGYHVSYETNYDSILANGLKRGKPCEHNWKSLDDQPEGVYIILHGDPKQVWYSDDTWLVTYCGPAIPDPLLNQGYDGQVAVLQLDVPSENIRLIDYDDQHTDKIFFS